MTTTGPAADPATPAGRRPRGAVRAGLLAAGVELARTGGPDAVVLREATRAVGVVPNAAYRHFRDRDELLAAVCAAAMAELGDRMAAAVAAVPGASDDPTAARLRLGAIGTAYLRFAREEPGLFATAFAVPQQHAYALPHPYALPHDPAAAGEAGPAIAAPGGAPGAGASVGRSASTEVGPATGPPTGGAPGTSVAVGRAASAASGVDRSPLGQLRGALDALVAAGVLDAARRPGLEFPVWSAVHGLAVLTGQGPLREVGEAEQARLQELTLAFIAEGLA